MTSNKMDIFQSEIPIGVVFNSQVNGLGIIRSLSEKKIPVLALDSNPRAIGLFSKYCKGIVCPNPKEDELKFIDFLIDIGKKLKYKGVLFLTDDVGLVTVSKWQIKLEKYYYFPMSKWDIIQNCISKEKMYQIAMRNNIPIPQTLFPKSMSELSEASKKIPYPFIIKPVAPWKFKKTYKIEKVEREEDLEKWLINNEDIFDNEDITISIQEIIPGQPSNLYTFTSYSNRESDIVGFSVIRKIIQSPYDFGTILSGEVAYEPEVIKLGTKVIKEFNYYGLSNTEFKKDSRDGKFKLMEINPRSGLSIYYTTKTGINLPFLAYSEAVGNNGEYDNYAYPITGEYGAIWVKFPICFYPLVKKVSNDPFRRESWLLLLYQIRLLLVRKKIFAVGSLKDPLPKIIDFLNSLDLIIKRITRRGVRR